MYISKIYINVVDNGIIIL